MPGTLYTGKAGHLAVMSEFCLRGYNAAVPEIDKGDDVFVVKDDAGAMWRLQVKTSLGKRAGSTRVYQFRVRETAISVAQTPDLQFAFVMRRRNVWHFLMIGREVLRSLVRNGMGSANGAYRQFRMVMHGDADRIVCSTVDLTMHLEDWDMWPKLA